MTISIIGAGNVAYHLGKRLVEKGLKVNQIIARNPTQAARLAQILNTTFETDFTKINTKSDLYIIAVSDNAIPSVSAQLSPLITQKLVVHTSGSIPSSILKSDFEHYGSLYPLQTFSLTSQPNFDLIPFFINANTPQYESILESMVKKMSPNVYILPDEKRIILHIAAVFVNNFTNHLFTIGQDIVEKDNLPFDILKPLINETVNKIQHNRPENMQTGPAKRGDSITIQKHIEFLKNENPDWATIYQLLSNDIQVKSEK